MGMLPDGQGVTLRKQRRLSDGGLNDLESIF